MKKEKLLIFEEIHRIHEIANTNPVDGKNLIVVDIQPEYARSIRFLNEFVNFLNENYDKMSSLTFLYNGYDTLGMINEQDYKFWWYEQELREEIIDGSTFYDKGYAFFRYCIDSSIEDQSIVDLVKLMMEYGVNDTRELDKSFWDEYIKRHGKNDVRELLEFSDDMINIPDLMDFLTNYNNIVLVGGGINECLKEVEIALNSLDKPYTTIPKFLY